MSPYAEGTAVVAEKSIAEIRKMLAANGATHYAYGSTPDGEMVQFALDSHFYRFEVPVTTAAALREVFLAEHDADWNGRSRADRINWDMRAEGEHRRRWRARVLWLKALLEFMDEVPLEQSLLANLVLPDGRTFGGWAAPQIDAMYDGGRMPPMLGDGRR
jgi:hypothetical protein